MHDHPSQTPAENPASHTPWAERLRGFLAENRAAMAAEWDHRQTEISLATIGRVDEDALRRSLEAVLQGADAPARSGPDAAIRVVERDGRMRVEKFHGCGEVEQIWTWRKIPWPTPEEVAGMEPGDEEEPEDWRVLAALAGTCGVLGVAGFAADQFAAAPPWLAPALYLLAMIAGGWDAAKDAIPSLFKGKLDIHFLMLAVAIGATIIGAYGEAALLLFLFSFAGALEHFALHRTRREINALFRLAPKTANRRDPVTGREEAVPIETIVPGDCLILRPGDTVPVDAKVTEGSSATDEASLTGEAHPVEKTVGAEVRSGTQNLWGTLVVECARPARESALQQVIRLIQDARGQRAPSQRFIDRFGPIYTKGVLAATLALFFVWWGLFNLPPFVNEVTADGTTFSALYRAMTLLVVASPCALVLSIPSAILAAIARGARQGILFRGGAAVEELAKVRAIAFDKTGTLTTGELAVESVESFPEGRANEVLALAAALEDRASHPLARAIVERARADGHDTLPPVEDFTSLTGLGVSGRIGGIATLLGSRRIFAETPLAEWAEALEDAPPGTTEVWLVHGDLIGRLLLRDAVRAEAAAVIAALRAEGVDTIMLTGDRASAAATVAESIGLDHYRASLTPAAKVAALAELRAGGRHVAMVGDGINDAPVLAAADVAFGMGGRGSDASLEQSDIVLMNDRLDNLPRAFALSRRARRIIIQNISIAVGTMAVMVLAAVFGLVPITLGVLAHEGSTVIVCLNSLRLLRRGDA
ncbi:MAG: heavy metal translocating P-type ATPase [Opitutales bacterium]|nr:heavy metal translocating P-type ATPase [Opitutales bacterium]